MPIFANNMKFRAFIFVITLCMIAFPAQIKGRTSRQFNLLDYRQEVRIGIGGLAFERTYFANSSHLSYLDRPQSATYMEKQNHRYIPHIFAEYDYTFRPWLTVGCQVDFSGFSWQNQFFHGGSNTPYLTEEQNCYNIVIQANCRFNWLRREHWMLYSGLGLGTDINTGTEADPYGNKTLVGVAVTPVVIGISAGAGHWFGSIDFNGINAMKDPARIFIVGGRLISISAGFKF